MHTRHWNIGLGLLFAAASLIVLLVWIPNDIESGLIIEERRSTVVGDALAPTAAAIAILAISLALVLVRLLARRGVGESSEPPHGLSRGNLVNIVTIAVVLIASLQVMVWAGPLCVALLQGAGFDLPEYRLLTDTPPYKYIGFAIGGMTLVAGLIAWIEGRLSLHAAAIGLGAVAVLVIVYDVPFDSLLLPPNGSQ